MGDEKLFSSEDDFVIELGSNDGIMFEILLKI